MRSNGVNRDVLVKPRPPDAPDPPGWAEDILIDAAVLSEDEFALVLSALDADAGPPVPQRGRRWERGGPPGREEPLKVLMHEELQAKALRPRNGARRTPTIMR
jgi:hypothetical protein